MGFFSKLKEGLSKTKDSFNDKINSVFSNFRKVDEDLLEELEEALIMSDVGVETSGKIINSLRQRVKLEKIEDEENVKEALKEEIQKILDIQENPKLNLETKPSVILVVGVNGVRKNNINWKNCKFTKKRRKTSCNCSSRYISCSSSRTIRSLGKKSWLRNS